MEIYKKENGNLIITVPLKTMRSNPYDDDLCEEMDNILGMYESEWNNGLTYRIDRDYKGKADEATDYFFKLNGTFKEFKKMCEDLGIDYISLESSEDYN